MLRRFWMCFAAFAAALSFSAPVRAQPVPPPAPEAPALVPPKLVSEPLVDYPAGASGDVEVLLEVLVSKDGTVREASPLEGEEPFATLAARAALGWSFEPATRDGVPVAAKIRLEVVFREPEAPRDELTPTAEESPGGEPTEEAAPGAPPPREQVSPREPLEVLVEGERPEPGRTVTLSRAEVRQIPGTFGDPFRAVETMPGVTPIVSGLPFFFIRGAPPGNVGYFLDGIRVPLLFHVGIGPSVVHPAMIDRVDLYPGGYPARFGRFAGGIVSGETVEPVREFHGEYNLRLFDAGALAEAPFAEGRGTALVGGRYSYTGLLLTLLSSETILEYWDYQGRATYDVTPDDQLGVFLFGSHDFLGEKTQTGTLTLFSTDFHRVDLRYDRALGERGTMRTAFTLGIDESRAQNQDRNVTEKLAGARNELTYRASKEVLVRAGTDLELRHFSVDLGPTDLSPLAQDAARFFTTRSDVALGGRADVVLDVDDVFEITPGMRVDLYGSEGAAAVGVEPRLSTRAQLSSRIAFLTTFGIAHQPPAFVVPVPGFQPGGLNGGLQRSIQESLGVEIDLGDSTTLRTTVFQNAFFNMSDPLGVVDPAINGCPPGAFPTDTLTGDFGTTPSSSFTCGVPRFPPGQLGPDRTGGFGQAADSRGGRRFAEALEARTMGWSRGLEIYLKRKLTKRVGGFVSYTLSRSIRSFGRRKFIATFDRTHVANAALAVDLGKRWRVGGRGTFYTGLPKVPLPGDPSTRLPPFFRLDGRVEKRWQLGETTWIAAVAEWMNMTLNKEAVTTRCTLAGCEAREVGPVTIPSVGIEGGF